MNDKQIVMLSMDVDNVLSGIIERHQTSLLQLTAVINARLMRIALETNSVDEVQKLLQHMAGAPEPRNYPTYSQH